MFRSSTQDAIAAAQKRVAEAERALAVAREAFDLAVAGVAASEGANEGDTHPGDGEDAVRTAREARYVVFDRETDVEVARRALEQAEERHRDHLLTKQSEYRQSQLKSFEQHAARLKKAVSFYHQKLADLHDASAACHRAFEACQEPLAKVYEVLPRGAEIAIGVPQLHKPIEGPAPDAAEILAAIDAAVTQLREFIVEIGAKPDAEIEAEREARAAEEEALRKAEIERHTAEIIQRHARRD